MRLRKIKNAKEKLESFSNLIVFEPRNHKGDWNTLFQNQSPIHIEIGMGKGKFLLEHARLNPNINYIGIERSESILLKAAKKIEEHHTPNIQLLSADAIDICEMFEENEVDVLYLNFSDPWPKTKHAKRRLTAFGFLEKYKRIIKPSGIIELKTDNRTLFEYSIIMFHKAQFDFEELSLHLHEDATNNEQYIVTTEYEDKFKSVGNPIYYIKVKVKK